MSTLRKWAELASQNERLVEPSDRPAESSGGTASAAEPQPRGQARAGQARIEPGSWPDSPGSAEPPLARSA